MYTVHGVAQSGNCYKVKLTLAQLEKPFTWNEVDMMGGATRSPEFLAMNPAGQVPVLQISTTSFLPQSNAILYYLAQGSALFPEDRLEQAQVMQWLFFEQYSHEPQIAVARFIVHFAGRPAEREAELQQKIRNSESVLRVMEQHLSERRYFVGERYSIADIALYAYTHKAHEGLIDLEPFPAVRGWLERVASQPGYVEMG
ncbi:glutathione S-transferase family protein [Silvimonas sp.]|uniref:glutathione S-transferase family protein n=1 Tax=Silvimonas sp. TaxID=2650811 RepID=UPI00284DCAF0|nr:glutathione S-transferase family protein [Silvimonas sp.]MDR3429733.1 glutathione S-transferase family protein [Silvimonas sp.]